MLRLPVLGRVMSLVRKAPPQRVIATPPRDERMKSAFDCAPIGMALASPDGRWLQVNQRFRDIVGYSREELSRITFHSMTHPDDAKREASLMRKLVAGDDDSYRIAKRTIDKAGSYRTLDVQVSLARGGDGTPDCFVYVVESAKDAKAAHTSAALLDEVDDVAIIRTDARGLIVGWNRGAQRLFGYERDEVIGKHRRVLYRDADTWDGSPTRQLTMAASGRVEVEDWRVAKDGRHLWVRTALAPFAPEGEVRGYIEVVTAPHGGDVVDTKKVVDDLRAEVEKRRRTEESLRDALTDLRTSAEETMNELKIMTLALRDEIDRRKALEQELRAAHDRLSAIPEPIVAEEQIVVAEELPEGETWLETRAPLNVLRDVGGLQRSGTVMFSSGEREKQFFVENGRVFSCASNDPSLFLTERLIASGAIDEDSRRRALAIQQDTHLAIGRILLILGTLTEDQLVAAMRDKLSAEIEDLGTWTDARWIFLDRDVPSLKLVPLRLTIEEILAPKPIFFASPNAKKVHGEACISIRKVAADRRIVFASIDEAAQRGYDACRICVR